MKKLFLTIFAAALVAFSANAQPYNWAIGLRGGPAWGDITVKHFTSAGTALDFAGAISFAGAGFEASGLYEWNATLANGLNFYYGPGVHAGLYAGDEAKAFALGILGVIGLEYKFNAPIALSLDWRPHLTYTFGSASGFGFGWADVGLGLKFCF